MRVLIVDDETLARQYLRCLLESSAEEVVGEADGAEDALRRTTELQPDVVFLDIQMPGLTGIEIAPALLAARPAPLLVFVSGSPDYALAAFEKDAVDYLLKPVAPQRFTACLDRLRLRLAPRVAPPPVPGYRGRAVQIAGAPQDTGENMGRSQRGAALQRLPVRADYAMLLLRMADIRFAEARQKHVYAHTREGVEYRTGYTLTQLESVLPDQFLRIHDSYLVNMDAVEEILFLGNHAYEVRVSGDRRLPVGRTHYADLRRRFGLLPTAPLA